MSVRCGVEEQLPLAQPELSFTPPTRSSGSPRSGFCLERPSEVAGAFDEDVSPYRCSSLVSTGWRQGSLEDINVLLKFKFKYCIFSERFTLCWLSL